MDQFFEKPIMKETRNILGAGKEFIEKNKNILTMYPSGKINYKNLKPIIEKIPQTRLEGYNIALDFIQNNELISHTIKDKIYLNNVIIEQGAFIYYFDILYKDMNVVLSEKLKQELDSKSMISVKVMDRIVKEADWISYSVEEEFSYEPHYITIGYSTPIDRMYSNLRSLGIERPVFENVELVYELSNKDIAIGLKWGIKYEGDWYYP
ncbi:hypothetical protein AN643_00975 [Candidatus Epulonipiscioides saccharophilum]|nr:hypothetical protein AN643_00975 [Epulopiscium sp. SCG-B10WGA-EpuloB]